MEVRRKKKTFVGLTMASLIDVIFLLLIFFMLSSEFVREKAIDVDLPESGVAETVNKENAVVFLKKDGTVNFQGKEVEYRELEDVFRKYFGEKGNRAVTVKAYRKSALDELVMVISSAKKAGATGVSIAAEKEK